MSKIVILGAGVVGLSTAIVLKANGHVVEIWSDFVPPDDPNQWKDDENDQIYSSIRAGAVWRSFAEKGPVETRLDEVVKEDVEQRQARWDKDTFEMLWKLSDDSKTTGVTKTIATEYHLEKPSQIKPLPFSGTASNQLQDWKDPWFKDLCPNYHYLEEGNSELPNGFKFAIRFATVDINPVIYIPYLVKKFKEMGGVIVQKRVKSIQQVIDPSISCIVNCTGLGAAFLSDTIYEAQAPDRQVYPARGITLLLSSPTTTRHSAHDDESSIVYIIPRHDDQGTCILGGTYEPNVWNLNVPETQIKRILVNCLKMDSSLADILPNNLSFEQQVMELRKRVTIKSGLRPCRQNGIRLESEFRESQGHQCLVIHNYGHSGWGFQASFGTGMDVLKLIHISLTSTGKIVNDPVESLEEESKLQKIRKQGLSTNKSTSGILSRLLVMVKSML